MEEDRPIIHKYPKGNPEDLIVTYFRFPKVINSKGKEVLDKRSETLLEVVHEPIGHILSKRNVALYLELFYPNMNVTCDIVEKCYAVFRLLCWKLNDIEDQEDGTFEFAYDDSFYKNLSTLNSTRTSVIKDLLSTDNPVIVCYDIGRRIEIFQTKGEDGKWIRKNYYLTTILFDQNAYEYMKKVWLSFPNLQAIFNVLKQWGLPSGVCDMILRFTTLGEKDCSALPEVDPFADDRWNELIA
jgi:hypothetical protein